MNYILPLLSVLLGYALALGLKPKGKQNLKLLLAFSGSFLLSLTVMHLPPRCVCSSNGRATQHRDFYHVGDSIPNHLRIFLQRSRTRACTRTWENHPNALALFISLCIHAFLEGFPVGHHANLAYGIAIHHLPIAIILTTFFLNAELNKTALFLFMLTFAIMTPLGTWASHYFPILNDYYSQITAIVIGILFYFLNHYF